MICEKLRMVQKLMMDVAWALLFVDGRHTEVYSNKPRPTRTETSIGGSNGDTGLHILPNSRYFTSIDRVHQQVVANVYGVRGVRFEITTYRLNCLSDDFATHRSDRVA